jgi:Protein of unknown function (DUF3153)
MNKTEQIPRAQPQKSRFFWLLPFAFCLLIFLSGCVNYDVGINFNSQHRGTFVQHIKLGEKLTSFSQSTLTQWFDSLEQRAQKLQGKTKKISPQEIIVTIPFNNGKELTSVFNSFFNPNPEKVVPLSDLTEPEVQLSSKVSLQQSNLLLVQRDRLSMDIDLRAFDFFSNQDKLILNPASAVEIEIDLNTPWGAKSINRENYLTPQILEESRKLVWQLQPGQVNYIEAVFWLPSPIGVGAIAILLIVLAGFFLKYKSFPWGSLPQQSLT